MKLTHWSQLDANGNIKCVNREKKTLVQVQSVENYLFTRERKLFRFHSSAFSAREKEQRNSNVMHIKI